MDQLATAAPEHLKEEEVVGEHRERQRRQRQVEAGQTQRGKRDDGAHDPGGPGRGQDADRRRPVGDLRRHHGADADERHLTQRRLPPVAGK